MNIYKATSEQKKSFQSLAVRRNIAEKNYERQPKISPRAFDNNYKNIKAKEEKIACEKKKQSANDIIH